MVYLILTLNDLLQKCLIYNRVLKNLDSRTKFFAELVALHLRAHTHSFPTHASN